MNSNNLPKNNQMSAKKSIPSGWARGNTPCCGKKKKAQNIIPQEVIQQANLVKNQQQVQQALQVKQMESKHTEPLLGVNSTDISIENINNKINEIVSYLMQFKGERGEIGPQGEQGERGPQGEQGPQGLAFIKSYKLKVSNSAPISYNHNIVNFETNLSGGVALKIDNGESFTINEDGVYMFLTSGYFNIIDYSDSNLINDLELNICKNDNSVHNIKRNTVDSDTFNYFNDIYIEGVTNGDTFTITNKTGYDKAELVFDDEMPLEISIIKLS